MPAFVGRLAKFWTAAGGAVITGVSLAWPGTNNWLPVVVSIVTTVLVYIVPNSAVSTHILTVTNPPKGL